MVRFLMHDALCARACAAALTALHLAVEKNAPASIGARIEHVGRSLIGRARGGQSAGGASGSAQHRRTAGTLNKRR